MPLALWRLASNHSLSRVDTEGSAWLTANGDGDILSTEASPASSVNVIPVESTDANDGVIAAALVSPQMQRNVIQNGSPLSAGLHVLRTQDRLEIGPHSFWVSTTSAVERAEYDPAIHGEDNFCFMTKSRLSAGDPITICRGNAGSACGTIYKAKAWEAAVDSGSGFKCPNCGYDPSKPEWQPEIREKKSLDDLLRLISERRDSNE